ncbi:MAG TPA: glycosyltransferase family 2 protein [Bacilli bacterium]|nr:glycosyltransferase family 2 protein [Bacilli bacterium]
MLVLSLLTTLTFAYWLAMAVASVFGLRLIPRLQVPSSEGYPPREEPLVSIIVAGKDEEEAIADTCRGLLQQRYGRYELIVVNDRSEDRTGERLAEVQRFAEQEGITDRVRFEVVTIHDLPEGWLGKNHALYQGYLRARGDVILFTDADVRFHPDTLRSSIRFFQDHAVDHLTLIPIMSARGYWLQAFVKYFLFSLCLAVWPWLGNIDRQRRTGMGIGAFNMLSRSAYEQIGTHEALAMRPDDDLYLGMKVKREGLRQRLVTAPDFLEVEWYPNLGAAVRGLEKNTFAGLKYSLPLVVVAVAAQFFFFCFPFFAVWLYLGTWQGWLYAGSLLLLLGLYYMFTSKMSHYKGSQIFALPFTVLLFLYIVLRSVYLTYKRGGVYWRGTFYSLQELRNMKK